MGCPGVHAAARVYYSEVSSFHAVGIRPVDRRLEILWQMPRIRIRRARTFQGCQFPRLSYWRLLQGRLECKVAVSSPTNRFRIIRASSRLWTSWALPFRLLRRTIRRKSRTPTVTTEIEALW